MGTKGSKKTTTKKAPKKAAKIPKIKSSKTKRIGILGGSFDPPTISHLQLCSEALNLLKFDEMIFDEMRAQIVRN